MMKAGRPSGYNAKYHVPWVKSLAKRGLTVKEIASELGIAKSTLCKWVKEHEELSDALNCGRDIADSIVEDTLYKQAVGGYKIRETRTITEIDENGQPQPTHIETCEKEIGPNTTACIFWLKNRKPNEWRDKPVADLDAESLATVAKILGAVDSVIQ